MALQPRSEADLRDRQGRGQLRVSTAAAFRQLVAAEGLEAAYAATDVVVASTAEFTDQASLVLNLGPSDPPIRIRRFQLDGVEGWGGHGSTDLDGAFAGLAEDGSILLDIAGTIRAFAAGEVRLQAGA